MAWVLAMTLDMTSNSTGNQGKKKEGGRMENTKKCLYGNEKNKSTKRQIQNKRKYLQSIFVIRT